MFLLLDWILLLPFILFDGSCSSACSYFTIFDIMHCLFLIGSRSRDFRGLLVARTEVSLRDVSCYRYFCHLLLPEAVFGFRHHAACSLQRRWQFLAASSHCRVVTSSVEYWKN